MLVTQLKEAHQELHSKVGDLAGPFLILNAVL